MPYYIRFLKSPRLVPNGKKDTPSHNMTSLITITSDLGDSFLAEDAEVVATLRIGNDENASEFHRDYRWKASDRELRVTVGPVPTNNDKGAPPRAQLSVRAADALSSSADLSGRCRIISAWSPLFIWAEGGEAEKLVQRRFKSDGVPELQLWEETGNSIARHIWDAALACVTELQNTVAGPGSSVPSLQALVRNHRDEQNENTHLSVIELGTGCGIVGIALAQVLPRCSVCLTDLEEARDIVGRNISVAKPAAGSTARFEVLDWNETPGAKFSHQRYDLIIVSDCTYNSDSMPALVRTLRNLTDFSPNATVVVAIKRRHESEVVFFALMEEATFEKANDTANDRAFGQAEDVEIHCFQRRCSR